MRSKRRSCSTRRIFDCTPSAELADLVEKDRAAVGQLELAELPSRGAGERTLLVSEQLILDERRRGWPRS